MENPEREVIAAYVRSLIIMRPLDEAENHMNDVLASLADDIECGKHRQFERSEP